jgi:heme exporter protein CcmD
VFLDLGPHATFIWASYALFLLVLGALATWLVLEGRRQERALADLEARGIKRRAARS